MLVKPNLYTKEKAVTTKLRRPQEAIPHYIQNINDNHWQSQRRKQSHQSKPDDNSRSEAGETASWVKSPPRMWDPSAGEGEIVQSWLASHSSWIDKFQNKVTVSKGGVWSSWGHPKLSSSLHTYVHMLACTSHTYVHLHTYEHTPEQTLIKDRTGKYWC